MPHASARNVEMLALDQKRGQTPESQIGKTILGEMF
jgi:hypothetical protein